MTSRLKERGGGGVKIMASKPQSIIISDGTPRDKAAAKRNPTAAAGKENHRSLSGGRAAVICSISALKKPLEKRIVPPLAGVRWSTSSMPKGKSLIPSDYPRMLPDLRRASGNDRMLKRDSESETGQKKPFAGFSGLERCKAVNGLRGLENCKPAKVGSRVLDGRNVSKAVNVDVGLEDCSKKDDFDSTLVYKSICKESNGITKPIDGISKAYREVRNQGDEVEVDVCINSSSISSKGKSIDVDRILDACNERNILLLNRNALPEVSMHDGNILVNRKEKDSVVSESEDCGPSHVSLYQKVGKHDDMIQVFENMNTQKPDGGSVNVCAINKYPSKLHEKLALLEGRVQKIASEIKRTKEMLDQNNPDQSKLVLSEIQNKISGIEKAIGHVVNGSSEIIKADDLYINIAGTKEPEESVDSKTSVKGLNHDELEARFFPHHRLLRNRTSLGSLGELEGTCMLNLQEHGVDPEVKNGSLSPIDENQIALEFLASIGSEQPNMLKQDSFAQMDDATFRKVGMEKISSIRNVANKATGGRRKDEIELLADEKIEEFDDQENTPTLVVHEMPEDFSVDQLREIGQKSSTGGWFVSEGEAVLLAHNDSSCSYHDIINIEAKAEYKPPSGVSDNTWGDCWLIRAPGADGSSGRYVVAASAGNSTDSGFCSWDFYTREINAFQIEGEKPKCSSSSSRSMLASIPNSGLYGRSTASTFQAVESPQWWYKPCGPLLISTKCRQKIVSAYDIRDGDRVMTWEVSSPVATMEFSSPLQWRSRGKVIVAETEAITLWDVNSLTPQPLLAIPSAGKKIYSLHVNNSDAESGGGVRQRVSSSEVEGNDGVFCTQDSVNVCDFRLSSGVGLKISRHGANGHSIYTRGDSIFIGCTDGRSVTRGSSLRSRVQHFSLRKGMLANTFELPDFNSHVDHSSITQVWGNSDLVMGICGAGLFVFDTFMDESSGQLKEVVGPDNLFCPTFDYLGSRVLIISRDRPASWRYFT